MTPLSEREAEVVRLTGRLVTHLTDTQTARLRIAAAERGWLPTEYLRRRIVARLLAPEATP